MFDFTANPQAERQREHQPSHIRTIEAQTLDALLRIEELLNILLSRGTSPAPVKPETPKATPTTKKNSREL